MKFTSVDRYADLGTGPYWSMIPLRGGGGGSGEKGIIKDGRRDLGDECRPLPLRHTDREL